jgi:hypothetical protein
MPTHPDPIGNDRRRVRRLRGLPPDACCVLCGETSPPALIVAKRTLLEQHHVVGEANADGLTVPLCRNCHAVETERLRDHGVELERDRGRSLPEVILSILRALASFFRSLAESFDRWADQVADFVTALDLRCPGWRELPEAQA